MQMALSVCLFVCRTKLYFSTFTVVFVLYIYNVVFTTNKSNQIKSNQINHVFTGGSPGVSTI